jgi:hypothetical protein
MIIMFGFITAIMVGCSNNNTNGDAQNNDNDVNTESIHYETNQEQANRLGTNDESTGEKGGRIQSDQSGTNASNGHSGNYQDIFTNEETDKIYSRLIKLKEIKQAQVATTDDRIVVAVMLNRHAGKNIGDKIENETRKVVPNKEVYVYTDDVHWNDVKNLRARSGPANAAENVKDDIKRLFHIGND